MLFLLIFVILFQPLLKLFSVYKNPTKNKKSLLWWQILCFWNKTLIDESLFIICHSFGSGFSIQVSKWRQTTGSLEGEKRVAWLRGVDTHCLAISSNVWLIIEARVQWASQMAFQLYTSQPRMGASRIFSNILTMFLLFLLYFFLKTINI